MFSAYVILPTDEKSKPPGSVFVFWQIGANVAKFSRTLDEVPLSPCSFLTGHRLVAEGINFAICHLGCLAPASFAKLRRRSRAASKTALCEPSDRLGPRWQIALFAAPIIDGLQK
jgi:hypothetical protein